MLEDTALDNVVNGVSTIASLVLGFTAIENFWSSAVTEIYHVMYQERGN